MSRRQPSKAAAKNVRVARRSRVLASLLGIWFVIPFAVLFTLMALEIRFGQGYFAYRYSMLRGPRAPRAGVGIAIGALACGAVWFFAQKRRAVAWVMFVAALALWGVWSFWAPPYPMTQQMFAMTSPSADGAFVVESLPIQSPGAYLRDFDRRLKMSIEAMQGTRVLSNPPGMTIFAWAVRATSFGRDAVVKRLVEEHGIDSPDAPRIADALRVGMALCAAWALTGLVGYGLGRVFLSPAGACLFAILVTFNPCTVEFVPGKDPAQLLTINAMLWAWFAGAKRDSFWMTIVAGAIFIIGCTFGLVHIWVALIAVAASGWQAVSRDKIRRFVIHCSGAAIGAILVVALVYAAIGWNIPATLLAVSRRWSEIQKTFDMSRPIWFAIGLPIFLLFLTPGFWALAALSFRRRRLNFGTRLVLCTLAVMAFIYIVTGVTYELPRLWVAFLPTLILGLCIDRPLLRGNPLNFRRGVAMAMVLIVGAQIVFTALHWTIFDIREAEYRLISQRYYQ